jgi:DsbC/DsbD-like thiol-disulfide interchange protein
MIVLVTVLAAGADDVVVSRAEVRLAPLAIQAGGRLPVAVRFSMAPGWHTYAENPGDSGMPPEITLTGPDGFVLEKWQFPPAKSFTDAAGTTFGYENAVVLIGALQLPASLPAERTFELEFNVAWMVCKDVCVPLSDTLKVPLKAQPEAPAEARLEWERFLEAGGWSACVETRKEGEKPAK